MKKYVCLSLFAFICLLILIPTLIYIASYEKKDPLSQEKKYINKNIEFEIKTQKKYSLFDDDINISMIIFNNGTENISINPFDLSSIYFNITAIINDKNTTFFLESKFSDIFNGNFWNNQLDSISLEPGKNISLSLPLRKIQIPTISKSILIDWNSLGDFIDNTLNDNLNISLRTASLTIRAFYIPLKDLDYSISSNECEIFLKWVPTYNLEIHRNLSEDEMEYLEKVETLNYSSLLGVGRYDGSSYDMPVFIDKQAINEIIEEKNGFTNPTSSDGHHFFIYEVNVKRYTSVQIDNKSNSIDFIINETDSELFWYKNLTNIVPDFLFYGNEKLIEENNSDIETGYILDMIYSYNIYWDIAAAVGVRINQEVVITDNFEILCIRTNRLEWIS